MAVSTHLPSIDCRV